MVGNELFTKLPNNYMTRDEIVDFLEWAKECGQLQFPESRKVDFLEWAKECGQLQFPESRKVDMAEMYIKEQDAVNKTCNIQNIRNCTTCKMADAIYDEKCCKCDRTYSMWEQG